jgi:hypothetical protein
LSDEALADAEFIAAARSFVPDALAAIERLEGEKAAEHLRAERAISEGGRLAFELRITKRTLSDAWDSNLTLQEQLTAAEAHLAARDAEVAQLQHWRKEASSAARIVDDLLKAEAEVARLTEEVKAEQHTSAERLAESADYANRLDDWRVKAGDAEAALATLRGKVKELRERMREAHGISEQQRQEALVTNGKTTHADAYGMTSALIEEVVLQLDALGLPDTEDTHE